GRCDSIAVNYPPVVADKFATRLPTALLFAASMAALILFVRLGLTSTLTNRWPHALGVVAGLAWWLWLTPSILGWVLVLLSLGTSLRSFRNPADRSS
ncbi:hypothetical protein NIL11_27015, partial [Klebsiella pneumoniae]|uniref:hypothetical protein n=1 Tax=Klebsiella pneumoniae TaxID=573 RepID=UPI0021F6F7A0